MYGTHEIKAHSWDEAAKIAMGYKTLDVKEDIHEDVESYMKGYDSLPDDWKDVITHDILDIVDKHFEKIER